MSKAGRLRLVMLVVAAALVLTGPINNQLDKKRAIAKARAADTVLSSSRPAELKGQPVRILIPSAGVDLPVVKGVMSDGKWTVSPVYANWASTTAPINNRKAQSLIYGHNNKAVFGPLLNLGVGDLAYIYTDNSHIFKYRFTGSQDISPQKQEIFADMANSGPGLKLITCEGAYFQYRHLMNFSLVKAS
jgi:LPXTG-site transpeptidase (sortase) family protein